MWDECARRRSGHNPVPHIMPLPKREYNLPIKFGNIVLVKPHDISKITILRRKADRGDFAAKHTASLQLLCTAGGNRGMLSPTLYNPRILQPHHILSCYILKIVKQYLFYSSICHTGMQVYGGVRTLSLTTLCESLAKIKIKRGSRPQTARFTKCFYNHQK